MSLFGFDTSLFLSLSLSTQTNRRHIYCFVHRLALCAWQCIFMYATGTRNILSHTRVIREYSFTIFDDSIGTSAAFFHPLGCSIANWKCVLICGVWSCYCCLLCFTIFYCVSDVSTDFAAEIQQFLFAGNLLEQLLCMRHRNSLISLFISILSFILFILLSCVYYYSSFIMCFMVKWFFLDDQRTSHQHIIKKQNEKMSVG